MNLPKYQVEKDDIVCVVKVRILTWISSIPRSSNSVSKCGKKLPTIIARESPQCLLAGGSENKERDWFFPLYLLYSPLTRKFRVLKKKVETNQFFSVWILKTLNIESGLCLHQNIKE